MGSFPISTARDRAFYGISEITLIPCQIVRALTTSITVLWIEWTQSHCCRTGATDLILRTPLGVLAIGRW